MATHQTQHVRRHHRHRNAAVAARLHAQATHRRAVRQAAAIVVVVRIAEAAVVVAVTAAVRVADADNTIYRQTKTTKQ